MISRKLLRNTIAVLSLSGTLFLNLTTKALAQSMVWQERGFLDPGRYVEHHFYGLDNQSVSVLLNSNDFDTRLSIYDPYGRLIGENDDYNGTNSGLDLILPSEGGYRIVVEGYALDQRGRYDVSVYDNTPEPVVEPINIREQGFLDAGRYVEHYFEGIEGQTVTVSLQSSDFDTYLAIYSPTNRLLDENDDDGGSLNSRLRLTLGSSGRYRILVQGYSPEDDGRYTLTIE
jgi:hypothetical protein